MKFKKQIYLLSSCIIFSCIILLNIKTQALASNLENKPISEQKEKYEKINEWSQKDLSNEVRVNSPNIPEYILVNNVTGQEISDVYTTRNGIPVKLTPEEALNILNNTPKSKIKENINKDITNYAFSEEIFKKVNSPTKILGETIKLSHDVHGGSLGASIEISQENLANIKEYFSITRISKKSAIRYDSNIEWSKSLNIGIFATHNIQPNKVGYVAFKPYYNEVEGVLTTYEIPSGAIMGIENVTARTPINNGYGLCDGIEYIEYVDYIE